MSIAFVAVEAKVGGGSGPSLALPNARAGGDMLIAARAAWSAGTVLNPATNWTASGDLEGGTGASVDAHITRARGDRYEVDGNEANPAVFSGTSLGGTIGLVACYSKASGTVWQVATATGDDATHGANRSATSSTNLDLAPGDRVIAIVATDTDTTLASVASIAFSASGITFGTAARRSPSSAGNTSGQDGNVEIFDADVSSGSGTVAVTFSFNTSTSQCGPVVFIRLREFDPNATVTPARISPPAAQVFSPNLSKYKALSIGMVVTGTAGTPSPNAQDTSIRDELVGRPEGNTVTYLSSADTLPNSGYDVLLITESGSSSSAAIASIPTCSLPVMLQETSVNTMRFCTSASSNALSGTQLDITTAGNSHSITTGLADPLTVRSSSGGMFGFPTSEAPAGVEILAVNNGATTSACLAVADAGATLTSGTAPARRAYFGLGVGTSVVAAWTQACRDLQRATLDYLGASVAVPATVTPARISTAATIFAPRGIRTWDDIAGETMIWGGTSGHPYTTTGGTGSTFDLDHTADSALGDRSIKITTNGTNQNTFVRKLNGTSFDWTDKTPRIWFKVDNKARIADLNLWLGSGGGLANAYIWSFDDLDMTVTYYNNNEWVCLTLPWSKATVSGTPNRAALTDLNLQIFDGSVGVLNFWWGGLSAIPERSIYPNGVVSFTFDDGLDEHYNIAAPYLQGKGYVGTGFIIADRVDQSGFVTTSQMQALQNTYGWELGLHSNTLSDHDASTGFNALTDSQIKSNLASNRSFMTGAGITDPESFAYPQGYYNENTAKSVGDVVRNARTTKGLMFNTAPVGDRRKIFCQALDASTTVGTVQGWIDTAKANQEWLVLLFHEIVASGATGGQVLTSTFQSIVDYVQTQNVGVQTVRGVQNLEPPGVTVHPSRISPPAATVFAPTLKSDVTVTPARISPPAATVFAPTIGTGTTVTPARISPPTATVFAPSILASGTVTPARISPPTATVFAPTVQTGATPTPSRISPPTAQVFSPTLISHATVTPARISTATTIFAPTVSAAGNATPQPARIEATTLVRRPTIRLPAPVMQRERGISVSGAEFTPSSNAATQAFSNVNRGTYDSDYRYEGITTVGSVENRLTFDYLRGRGWKTVKIPIRWERIQPTLNAALNTTELNRLTAEFDQANVAGLKVVLDIHNYGLYYIDGSQTTPTQTTNTGYRFPIGSTEVPASAFADLWSRLATAFNLHAAVVGVHIMNEPQSAGGLTRAVWYDCAQAAVDAIRAVNTSWVIRVGGWQWSDVFNWTGNNLAPWISDPTGKVLYEGHHYWAETNDAGYTTYANALADAVTRGYTAGSEVDALHSRILDELNDFKAWGTTYGVGQIVGEAGWPGNASGGDQALWDALGERYLDEADSLNMHIDAWSTGEFYGNVADPLLIYHASNAVTSGVDTTRADAAEWEAHIEGDALVTPSRINGVATVFSPTVKTGATVTLARIDSVAQITNPTIGAGAGPTPARISTTGNVFAPVVSAQGNATVTPARITTAATVFAPNTQASSTVTPARISPPVATVFTPVVRTGASPTPVRIFAPVVIFAPFIDTGEFEEVWTPDPGATALTNPAGAVAFTNPAGAEELADNPAGAASLTENASGATMHENPAGTSGLAENKAGASPLEENTAGATWEVT